MLKEERRAYMRKYHDGKVVVMIEVYDVGRDVVYDVRNFIDPGDIDKIPEIIDGLKQSIVDSIENSWGDEKLEPEKTDRT